MTREYLFRGKKISDKVWIEGSLILWPDGRAEIAVHGAKPGSLVKYAVIPATVGMWTTQLDKKGDKIFEGDILEGHGDGLVVVKWVEDAWECIFSDGGNILLAELVRYFGNNAVIIGNIHDNRELFEYASES